MQSSVRRIRHPIVTVILSRTFAKPFSSRKEPTVEDPTGYYAAYQRIVDKCNDVSYDERVLAGLQRQRLRDIFVDIYYAIPKGVGA
jgi:hypothetical protein